jgi:hypothetical protein
LNLDFGCAFNKATWGSVEPNAMNSVLKGNFKPKNQVDVPAAVPETLEERFERAAFKRLGGSIAFVAKKKVMWDLKDKS